MAPAFDATALVLGAPPADLGDAVEAATGASLAALLACPGGPPWGLLAIIIAPLIEGPPDIPDLAHALSISGITSADWADRVAIAIEGEA